MPPQPFVPSSKPIDQQVIAAVFAVDKRLKVLEELMVTRLLPDPYRITVDGGNIVIVNAATGATTVLGAVP